MGYDMTWYTEPAGDEAKRYYDLSRQFDLLCKEVGRDRTDEQQAEISRLYDEMYAANFWYFRLNIWGMQQAREELERVGVVNFRYSTDGSEGLDWSPSDCPGIPGHKLCSNDGWHVLPFDITSGIGHADQLWPDWRNDLTDYVQEFVAWMEQAAERGDGFLVY